MTRYFIIPARGGSKGIKNKNLQKIDKFNLVEWSIIHALFLSSEKDRIIVSSDSEKILNAASKYRVDPQKRISKLSGDKVFTEPVMIYALSKYDVKDEDTIILLQPTSPLRRKKTLLSCLNAVEKEGFNSSITVQESHQFKWSIKDNYVGIPLYKDRPRRQDMEPEYVENGSIYITKYKNFRNSKNRISGKTKLIFSQPEESVDIDNLIDLKITKSLSSDFVKEWQSFIKSQKISN